MNVFFNQINYIILIVLSVSSLIGILDYVGFLPPKFRKWMQLNRMDNMLALLRELGVDVERRKRVNSSLNYPQKYRGQEVEKVTKDAIENYRINKKIAVGHTRRTQLNYYYDIIGATCDRRNAEYFANIMSTYWASHLECADQIHEFTFDFIVTPKAGSPILGYEFAKLMKKPFVMHEESQRFELQNDMRQIFDCVDIPEKNSIALIVDDSTTGGRMVRNTIDDLREYGYVVHTCFVIFEPQNKNARQSMADKNVELVSIIKTHTSSQ